MNAKEVIKNILEEKKEIKQVYWVACGGSLIDLYPAHVMVNTESEKLESGWYTSKEFLLMPPKKLGKESLLIVCSHSGNTKETVDAAILGKEKGATVITLTDVKGSKCDSEEFIPWVYPWGDDVPTSQIPSGITLSLAAELIQQQEGFSKYDMLMDGIQKMDDIVKNASKKVTDELGEKFADCCEAHKFFYILGSGATFSQTYGFAICSLMEMQWQNCAYVHSGEYFHGPFEVTENGVFYFLQMGSGICREMDERALAFLKTHTDSYMVVDAKEYGMEAVDKEVADYLDPILFYTINCRLREARGRRFDHDVDTRRYMGKEEY